MKSHRALLIVDVQRAFEPPPAFLKRLQSYAKRFPCRVFTRFVNPADSMFRRVLKQRSCAPGTADNELLIVPDKGDLVFEKQTYGLPPVAIRALQRRGITQVAVAGVDTDACVLGAMFSLFDNGIECHLKENMCWSSSGLHDAAIKIIREQFPETK